MTKIKNIWQKTFLGKLLSTDPIFGRMLSILLVIYLFIHVFRLEMYPMYMYAMFSKQEVPRDAYHAYKIYNGKDEMKVDYWDYREYTVLMNTISQYDDILANNLMHPETHAIDKFIDRLHLGNSTIKSKLKGSFKFSKPQLEENLGNWVADKLKINPKYLRIEKEAYNWSESNPRFINKVNIYGVD